MNSLQVVTFENHFFPILRAIALIVLGFLIAQTVGSSLVKIFHKRLSPHQATLVKRFTFYLLFVLFVISAIQELGFNIGTLLGATGILTIALGIASQNSLSNIVSGIFIIGEKSFRLGDTIKINDVQGEILSMDLLSVKVRTADNIMVRLPNELLIKTPITNMSYFSQRRADLIFAVGYKENLDQIKKLLFDIAHQDEFCLADPAPTFYVLGLGEKTITLQFSVFSERTHYYDMKNSVLNAIKTTFADAHIEMSVGTEPVTIKMMN